jgi:hypothetical protein
LSVFDPKRLIDCKFVDAEVQADIKHFPFKVHSKDGKPYITVEYRGEEKEFVSTTHTVLIGADADLLLF